MTVAQLFHQLGRRVAQMHWHFAAFILLHKGAGLVVCHITGIALGCDRQINHGLPQRQLSLGTAQALEGQGSIVGNLHGARIGQTDIFPSHTYDTARQITGICSAVQHPGQPIQGSVRVGTTYRLMQSRNLVVEVVAPLVKTPGVQGQSILQEVCRDQLGAGSLGGRIGLLQQVQKASGIAVGITDQGVDGLILKLQAIQGILFLYTA